MHVERSIHARASPIDGEVDGGLSARSPTIACSQDHSMEIDLDEVLFGEQTFVTPGRGHDHGAR
jgi:hypothetical protein